jgi:asparagine synthase (glutamine-hydrolysing)
MCGIYGLYSREVLSDQKLKKINNIGGILKHRGPDGEGFWHEDNIALGHRRLAILDVTHSGVQPMHYKDGINDISKANYIERLYGPICTTWWMNNNYS